MAVLLLDPLLVTLVIAVFVYAWLVWRGTLRWWFGRADWWVGLAWPGPLVVLAVLLVAGSVAEVLTALGTDPDRGTAVTAAIYLGAYGVPLFALTLAPPRWLLPDWARARITAVPEVSDPPGTDVIPAVNVGAGRPHGTLTRWAWRVDGTPGYLEIGDGVLRFRACDEAAAGGFDDLDADALEILERSLDAAGSSPPPRGGWWTRRHADVPLTEIDELRRTATRRGRRDGVLVIVVTGRRPLHLWVDDVRALERELARAGRPV
ncbi:MAG: hypothetical protein ACOCT8_05225 [Actinomycetota bacterium]